LSEEVFKYNIRDDVHGPQISPFRGNNKGGGGKNQVESPAAVAVKASPVDKGAKKVTAGGYGSRNGPLLREGISNFSCRSTSGPPMKF
jgi:hypothetical protein